MHRFFIAQTDEVDESQARIYSDDLRHQFMKVLRFGRGEKIILLDGSGYEFLVELRDFDSKKISGKILGKKFCKTELPIKLTMAFAILKNMEKFEFVLQKGTELGVCAFIPIITDRTERKVLGKVERLQRILKEAAEQSGRGKIPELLGERKFEKIFGMENFQNDVNDSNGRRLVIVPHPGVEEKFPDFCKKIMNDKSWDFEEIVVCVGPEGGFAEREIESAKTKGASLVSLGSRILRAETVPIVMSVLINQMLGEL